jgi:hypothetical protein
MAPHLEAPFSCRGLSRTLPLITNDFHAMSAAPHDMEHDMAPVFIANGNGSFSGSCTNNGSMNVSSEGWISGGGFGAEVQCNIRSPIEWGTGHGAVVEEVLPPDPDEIYRTVDRLCQMLTFFEEESKLGRLRRWIRFGLEGKRAEQPETFQYDEEPFDFVDRHALFVGRNMVNVPRQKRPPHRTRDPRVGDLKVQVVEDFRQMTTNPKVKVTAVHQELADKHGISVSYVKQILRKARKIGAL